MHRITGDKSFWGLVVLTLLAAGVFSYFAYSPPDALEHSLEHYAAKDASQQEQGEPVQPGAAETQATETKEEGYAGALPDYSVPGVEKPFLSGGAAGIIGIAATFAVIAGAGLLLQSRAKKRKEREGDGQRTRTSSTA